MENKRRKTLLWTKKTVYFYLSADGLIGSYVKREKLS